MTGALGSWRQDGRVCFWRYRRAPKMYDGWHFAADKAGCASLLKLFDILSGETVPAHRTLSVSDPRNVGVDRVFGAHDLRLDVPAKLRLGNDLGEAASIGLSDDVFTMPLRPTDIADFSAAVRDIAIDHADFGVGFGEAGIIFRFWWWPKGR